MTPKMPLEAALQEMVEDGDVVLQAVATAVIMDKEGGKSLSHFRSTDLRTWEARGFVSDLADTLTAMEVARMFEDEDDDV